MKIIIINDICHDTLFRLDDGSKVWWSEMSEAQRDEENRLFRPTPSEKQLNIIKNPTEKVIFRALLALLLDPAYAQYVFLSNVRSSGMRKCALYKDVAYVAGKLSPIILSGENIGAICRLRFLLTVNRTKAGYAVILDDGKLEALISSFDAEV